MYLHIIYINKHETTIFVTGLDSTIWVELLTKQKPTAKSSRPFAHKKMPTGQKPTKHYRHCIKCGHLAVGIWSWGNGFGGQMSVGKYP